MEGWNWFFPSLLLSRLSTPSSLSCSQRTKLSDTSLPQSFNAVLCAWSCISLAAQMEFPSLWDMLYVVTMKMNLRRCQNTGKELVLPGWMVMLRQEKGLK